MCRSVIRSGLCFRNVRNSVLRMTQKEFARWLSNETGEVVTAQLVARMENCGVKKACNPRQPSPEIFRIVCSQI